MWNDIIATLKSWVGEPSPNTLLVTCSCQLELANIVESEFKFMYMYIYFPIVRVACETISKFSLMLLNKNSSTN